MGLYNLKTVSKESNVRAQDIQQALQGRFVDHKYFLFNAYVFPGWESDYISINESGYIYEIEIKVSKNDFKKDFKKTDKHLLLENKSEPSKMPNKYFFATPRGLLPSYQIPTYAGLIEITDSASGLHADVIKNAPFLHREKIFESLQSVFLEKFYHKYKRTEFENYELNKEIILLKQKLSEK